MDLPQVFAQPRTGRHQPSVFRVAVASVAAAVLIGMVREESMAQTPGPVLRDPQTAQAVAAALLNGVYSAAVTKGLGTPSARRVEDTWVVEGSSPRRVPLVVFAMRDGEVLRFNRSLEPNSLIPDSQPLIADTSVAARVAEAILNGVYGADVVRRQQPLHVVLRDSVWVVEGRKPRPTLGGVAHIEIHRGNAKVLRLIHGR